MWRSDKTPVEVWNIKSFKEIFLVFSNKVYTQDNIDIWSDGYIIPFPNKGDLSLN